MFHIKTRLSYFIKDHIPFFDGPRVIRIIPIGYACNHRCPMCWRLQLTTKEKADWGKNSTADLTIKDYQKIITHLPTSVKEIEVVGGGEPLLFKDIQQLLLMIKKRPVYGRLITNGSLFTQDTMMCCLSIQWDEIRISINAGTRSVYKTINGVDDFNRVVSNIKALQAIRKNKPYPKIILNYVVQRDNVEDIKIFIRMSNQLRVDGIHFDTLIQFKHNKNLVLDNKQRVETIEILNACIHNAPKIHNTKNIIRQLSFQPNSTIATHKSDYFQDKYCDIAQYSLDINSNGDTRPCDYVDKTIAAYNVKSMSIKNIWKGYREFRRRLYHGNFYSFCYSCTATLPKRFHL